jgi:beta-galactosidase/beta-glucuronidase
MTRRRASLDGTWEVALDPGAAPVPIVVPFTFEAPLSGIGRSDEVHERVRYRRPFRVPEDWAGSRVLLHFGAVDWRATVAVDGAVAGTHTGGYTSFSFDLGHLTGDHELVVDVEDPADGFQPRGKQRGSGGIWYTRATGIWQSVWLEAVPDAYIRHVSIGSRTQPSNNLLLGPDVRVETSEPIGVEVDAAWEETRPWSPEDPALYDVRVTTESGDEVVIRTGSRTIERRGSEILLNGRPRRLCGVLDQGYWPDGVYTAPTADALRTDVEGAKAMGFDLARMHVKVADERWYDWCDRLGLMVAQDIPSPLHLSTEEARRSFVAEVEKIVHHLCRHPCVVMWILFNEDWGEPPAEFQRELVGHVQALDPTRLVVDASGWTHRGEGDLVDVHDYGDDLARHASTGDRPLWLGECGGVSLAPPGAREDFAYARVGSSDQLAAEYARLVGRLGDVAGFVWTQLTDVEGELNGLYTSDRRPKVPPESIRAVNARERRDR